MARVRGAAQAVALAFVDVGRGAVRRSRVRGQARIEVRAVFLLTDRIGEDFGRMLEILTDHVGCVGIGGDMLDERFQLDAPNRIWLVLFTE